jgi:translocation protein SEC63
MRLHAFFAQALPPSPAQPDQLAQLPGVKLGEVSGRQESYTDFVQSLEKQADGRAEDARKALRLWGRLEIVNVAFKGTSTLTLVYLLGYLIRAAVIGERIVTPSSIVYLVVKLRLVPPTDTASVKEEAALDVDETKRILHATEERDSAFLTSGKDTEVLKPGQVVNGGAHAPFWPGVRGV